ncbi:MAG: hypothetical protein NPIRA02_30220 [Nitrospirales bacterium]|nr:MAG: hypothetical protein NPIRA02_30220 [Nitrospirales bacterium]
MSKLTAKWLHLFVGVCFVSSLAACEKISIPRLSFDEKPKAKLPISVVYRFDPTLVQHTQVVDACGLPYTVNSGEIITETFLHVGQDHFASVSTQPTPTADATPGASNEVTVDLTFVQMNFEPIGRSGEEDRYHANVELQLQAVYHDSQGKALAQTPLSYADKVNMWTPALTAQSQSCATGQFDAVVEKAAETLANDMANALPRLYGLSRQPQPGVSGTNHVAPQPSPGTTAPQASLSFRTKLQDANDNLVLEGGENVILQIETTNSSSTSLPSAYIELRGSQAIVDAFAAVTTLPIPIGALQPGESKTTEVRGRMPATVEHEKGELVVSISLSQGIPPGAHTILAAIQPGPSSSKPVLHKKMNTLPSDRNGDTLDKTSPQTEPPNYALVIGLNEYQDPWPQAHQVPTQQIQRVASTLGSTQSFSQDRIKILNGSLATRTDIERTLFSWAKKQLTSDTIFLLYFAGHTLVDPVKGEVYLVPYEGSLTTSKKQLISLRSLQRVLGKLKVKLSLLFLDTPVAQYLDDTGSTVGLNGSAPANWRAAIPSMKNTRSHLIQIRRLQEKNAKQEPVQFLSGLQGNADRNRDGTVTLGEFLKSLEGTADIVAPDAQTTSHLNIPLAQ